MDAVDPEIRDEMLRYMSKELKAVREQLEEERRKTRMSGTPAVAKAEDVDVAELREENEAQQKRLEVLEEENARLWHHVARFESGEEDKPIALDISRSDDRHARLFELYYMPKDQHEAHCTKLLDRVKSAKEKRDTAREEARAAKEAEEIAKERAKAATEGAEAAMQKAEEADESTEFYQRKYKEAKSDLKTSRAELDEARMVVKIHETRIAELEEANGALTTAAVVPRSTPNLIQDEALNHITLLNDFLGENETRLLNSADNLSHLPPYRFEHVDSRLGFTVPREIRSLLDSDRQRGNGLWSLRNHQARAFIQPGLSRIVFLAPSHFVAARDTDGSYGWHPTSLWGDFDGRNRHIFYDVDQEWRYLGLYRSVLLLELRVGDMIQVHCLNAKGLAEKCITTKDMVPPLIVKHANQLWTSGAIRIVCFAFERIDDDGGMREALSPLTLRRPGASRTPSTHVTAGATPSNGRRVFTGPPVPILKPGQSSSAPPAPKSQSNKRPHKGSPGAASGSKNKKQKKNGA